MSSRSPSSGVLREAGALIQPAQEITEAQPECGVVRLDILHDEADQGKLDRDLLEVFTMKRIYEKTAKR